MSGWCWHNRTIIAFLASLVAKAIPSLGAQYCTFRLLFRDEPKFRAKELHASVHQSVAMGIPLISVIYGDDPLVGL